MAFTLEDFDKIWASTSPLTPYEFSDSNYQQGWNFIGATPPARQMWDFLQKQNDEKMQWLYNNKLSLSGGTMTGDIMLADGGKPLSSAVVGTVVSKTASDVSLAATTAKTLTSVSLSAGTWIVTGHVQYVDNTAAKGYAIALAESPNNLNYANDTTVCVHSVNTGRIALQTVGIFKLSSAAIIYLCGYATIAATAGNVDIKAIRIL